MKTINSRQPFLPATALPPSRVDQTPIMLPLQGRFCLKRRCCVSITPALLPFARLSPPHLITLHPSPLPLYLPYSPLPSSTSPPRLCLIPLSSLPLFPFPPSLPQAKLLSILPFACLFFPSFVLSFVPLYAISLFAHGEEWRKGKRGRRACG